MSDDDIEIAIKIEFLSEAAEIIDDMEGSFLEFEKDPEDKKILDNIFRMAHTIKGTALAAGFEPLGEFAHSVEALLDRLRSGTLNASPEIIDILLKSNDRIGRYVAALKEDLNAVIDTDDLESAVRDVMSGERKKGATSSDGSTTASEAARERPKTDRGVYPLLVVDDEPTIRELFRLEIEDLGVSVVEAQDGDEALAIVQKTKVGMIFTDLRMPGLNGLQLIERVRQCDKNVPIVLCSAFASREDIVKFIRFGAFDFLEKPVNLERVLGIVTNGLKSRLVSDSVMKIASLNFRCYVMTMKLLNQSNGVSPEQVSKLKGGLEKHLDEISHLSNRILNPLPVQKARESGDRY